MHLGSKDHAADDATDRDRAHVGLEVVHAGKDGGPDLNPSVHLVWNSLPRAKVTRGIQQRSSPVLFSSRRRRYAALVLVAAGIAYALVRSPLDTSNALAGVLGGLLALAGGVAALGRYLDARRRPVDVQAEGCALAAELLDRWGPELTARRQRSGASDALPVQWRQADPTARQAATPRRVVTGNPEQAVLDVAKAFRALPRQRAVLLGEPGGGKTFLAISLVVGLLTERAPDDKVPVLLSLSAWDPVEDDLDTFIVRALAAAHYVGAERIPEALLDKGVIFPVLDGLDELPEHLRRRALSRINTTLAGNRRILLTCRSVEYAEGIAAGAPALSQAPIFEIIPLTSGQISRYLRTEPRWASVADAVAQNPAGPLGIALSTPLMLSLFTRAYAGRDPVGLLALTSGNDVRDHLVDVLIDSVYPERGRGWTAARARRYLTYLARYLHRHAERELNWWKLPNRVLSPWTGALVGLAGGGMVAAVLTPLAVLKIKDPIDVFGFPLVSGCVFGLVCTALWFLGLGRRIDRSRLGFRSGARDGALLVLVPAAIALVITLATAGFGRRMNKIVVPTVTYLCVTAALAAVCALAVGLHRHLIARSAVVGRAEPADVLRRERTATLFGAATTLVVVSTLSVGLWTVVVALGRHIGQRTAATLDVPVVIRPVSDGLPELSAEFVTGYAVLILVEAVLVVVAVLLTSRWPRYVVAKVVLWGTGQLPLRLDGFLADARDKGLLRAGVDGYEFWHVALQERLVVRGKDMRMGRPVLRSAALGLAAVTAVACVVAVDLTQPAACSTTGLPQADSTMFTVVDAQEGAQCAAMLDATDVAKLLGEVPRAEAEKLLTPDLAGSAVPGGRLAVVGQFADMTPGMFRAVAEGMKASGVNGSYEWYTLPRDSGFTDATVSLLWSQLMPGYTAFLLRPDGSVLVAGPAIAPVTTKDPVEIARAAIKNAVGLPSGVSADEVLDGVDADECAQLREERFAKTIDLRGRSVSINALSTLDRCNGRVTLVVDERIPQYGGFRVWYLTEDPVEMARRCREKTAGSTADVAATVCTVVQSTQRLASEI